MPFSYSASGIVASGTDYISATRFIIQDTTEPAEIDDTEITVIFNSSSTLYGSGTTVQEQRVYYTALECARALHRRYAKQATFSSAGTSVQLLQRAEYWLTIVQDLALRLATLGSNSSLFAVVGRNPPFLDACGDMTYDGWQRIDRW